jgi:2-polyprenyl-3-methyl-5-hydroxy-6-metoxy-1,4-benzoquinol methylase
MDLNNIKIGEYMKCPLCNSKKQEQLLSLQCDNLDRSFLYNPIIILGCNQCGHVFNKLNKHNNKNLIKYYGTEYSLSNITSPNMEGDIPGSSNKNSLARYSLLFDFIKDSLHPDYKILDVGCAMGGFLHYLENQGYHNLYGIDFSNPFVEKSVKSDQLNIKLGSAESIPYKKNYFDFITSDQVVEHLFDPNKIFTEAKRVLKKNGLLCISVPNSILYDSPLSYSTYDNQQYSFDFFWFLMKEHLQHFDLTHLILLGEKHGFTFIDTINTITSMSSDTVKLQNLSVLFKNSDTPKDPFQYFISHFTFDLIKQVKEYIQHSYEKLVIKQQIINNLAVSHIPLHIFGISREFFYLYSNTNLSKCNIINLVDDTYYKQKFFTFKSQKIIGREILRNSKDYVLITACAHITKIKKILKEELDFKGETIEI